MQFPYIIGLYIKYLQKRKHAYTKYNAKLYRLDMNQNFTFNRMYIAQLKVP